MAIVCACLTTMRPLFTGLDLSFLSSISWTGRANASSSSTKSKERCSHSKDDLGKHQGKDVQFLAFGHEVEDVSKGGTILFVERTMEREDTPLEDGTSSPLTTERGGSLV